jgi:hypothetical protein
VGVGGAVAVCLAVREDAFMRIRSYQELSAVSDPAWRHVQRLIAEAAVPVRVMPPRDPDEATAALFRLQVTTQSTLGALAANCGAILVDGGWLRLLGSGLDGLPSLPEANGLGEPGETSSPPGHLVVGYDVLGGAFAVNGGGLPAEPGEICYFGPDTLSWTPIGIPGPSALLRWALAGGLAETFADLRWAGWEHEVPALTAGEGITCFPPLWSAEAHSRTVEVRRSPASLTELLLLNQESATQLADLPEGGRVRIVVTDD